MSPKEASACFDVTSAKKTEQDILGMLPDGQILTLPKNTRLNSNLAVCGSSGTGKSRSISRNLVLQAVKRGESLILTDPKSELYESMSEYLRDNGYTVKVFNLIEMDHSDSWNCLNEVGSSELMAQTFADIVLQNTSGDSKDAFWYNAELNLLKALVLYVALEMPPEQRNLATVYDLLYTQTEKGLSDIMASISHEHVNQYTGELLPPSPAAAPYAIFKQSSDTVRTSVIIGLGSKLAVLQAQQVRNITSYTGTAPAKTQSVAVGAKKADYTQADVMPKIPCSDGYVYEITDVSKYQNSMFATQETDTLPDPTCDWSLLDQPTLPEPEANHFTSGGKEYMFVRNLFETRRMQYTLYNAIGNNPQTWQNGKPVTRADGSSLVTVKLSIPKSVAANSFWPWRSDQIVELFNSCPPGEYAFEAWDVYCDGAFQYTEYYISVK